MSTKAFRVLSCAHMSNPSCLSAIVKLRIFPLLFECFNINSIQ